MVERRRVPVEQLMLDAVQSREEPWVGDERDQQLTASVASEGLLQDVLVRPIEEIDRGNLTAMGSDVDEDPEYAIVAGSRRYQAAMQAGYEEVPCKILRADDLEAAWMSLTENTTRRELSEEEIANQLKLIYEMVRPVTPPTACPQCGGSVADEDALLAHCKESGCELPGSPSERPATRDTPVEDTSAFSSVANRFLTEQRALEYVAQQFLGRTDRDAVSLVKGHLRTAELPPLLQSLFKPAGERSEQERAALQNYGIDTQVTLGTGGGKSGTSREVIALHELVASEVDADVLTPTEAVLETVGSIRQAEMSEQKLRRSLREFRHDISGELAADASATAKRETFRETLRARAAELRETYEEVEPTRPFRKVDVLGPETQRHSRWHAHAMQQRDVTGHGALVRELYEERLETLAEEEGWE